MNIREGIRHYFHRFVTSQMTRKLKLDIDRQQKFQQLHQQMETLHLQYYDHRHQGLNELQTLLYESHVDKEVINDLLQTQLNNLERNSQPFVEGLSLFVNSLHPWQKQHLGEMLKRRRCYH